MRARGGGRRAWSRRYPPLVTVVISLALAILALPSALNLPQANPGQTLEYAPVPGDQGKAPPGGAFAGLGLGEVARGSVGENGTGVASQPLPPPPPPPGVGAQPSTKNCVAVNGSPHQSEDPQSPPCVPFYAGSNGGATYSGVTESEVRVIFDLPGGGTFVGPNGSETTPTNTYVDLAAPPQQGEFSWVTSLRVWMRYFNTRYQTYNRFVHFWVYFGKYGNPPSPASRKADAEDNYSHVHYPFAGFSYNSYGNSDVYLQELASRGALVFGGLDMRTQSYFQAHPGLEWGYFPAAEGYARAYAAYVCRKVAPNDVSFSGNSADHGKRVFGLLLSGDQSHPAIQKYNEVAVSMMNACGMSFAATGHYPSTGYSIDTTDTPTYATQDMAGFKKAQVTTVIWPGGFETNYSHAATNLGYFPEWILGGDGVSEGNISTTFQDQTSWAHAAVVSPVTLQGYQGQAVEPACYDAYLEANPNANRNSVEIVNACAFYDDIRQMFTGIQVAGPHLTPSSMDQGFHAIPASPSRSAFQPSCFYAAGDYTCIKDAVAEHWDPNAATPPVPGAGTIGNGGKGCWRMAQNGARYLTNQWPDGEPTAQWTASDVCNAFVGQVFSKT
ncbi:MAG: hypothetical protein ACYDGR_09710 [Candidatus Dormibacteria bacterium]